MYFSEDADSVPTFESPWIHRGCTPAVVEHDRGKDDRKKTLISLGASVLMNVGFQQAFLGGAAGRESACQSRRRKRRCFNPWVRKVRFLHLMSLSLQ